VTAFEPTPSRIYIPIVTDAWRLVRVLFQPGAVFSEQLEKPTWFLPWVVVAVVMIINGIWMMPYAARMMELASAARGAPPEQLAQAGRFAVVGLVATPIMFLLFGALSAGIMYVTLMTTGAEIRFRGLMSASIFSSSAAVLQVILQSVAMRLRGSPAEAVRTMADARVSLGLDLLLPEDAAVPDLLEGVLAGIGPLQIWALVITAIGVLTLQKVSKGAAWTAALASYVVMLLVGAAFTAMGE
jgi:hypothetical protein